MLFSKWLSSTGLGIVLLGLFSGCATSEGPPFSPEEALKTFQLPEGFHLEIVASEPAISDPVAMAFNADGQLFVVQMGDYPMEEEPLGEVLLLEDLDHDGFFESSSIYEDRLNFPNSVLPWRDGILVAAAPDILYLPDRDKDGKADEREVLLTGFNPYNPQLRVNGLLYGIDNWIYGAYPKVGPSRRNPERFGQPGEPLHFPSRPDLEPVDVAAFGTDFRFDPGQHQIEPVSGNSQFGNTFDQWGNRFTLWNNNHIRHPVMAFRYLHKNPYLWVASDMNFPSDHENQSPVFPITENPIYIHESQVGKFTSCCGNSVYTGAAFPDAYQGAYFACEPIHNLIHCDRLTPKGASFEAERAFQEKEFLASTDPWFKPVFTTVGPDGALYIADYYRKYIEHPDYVPEGLEGQFDLRAGDDKGRIYRLVYEEHPESQSPKLQDAPSLELVKQLENPNYWWRINAQRLLVERMDSEVVPELIKVSESSLPEARIHALWTLEGLKALESHSVLRALQDPHPRVREQAILLGEKAFWPQVSATAIQLQNDPDVHVQFQLACTLALMDDEAGQDALRQIVARHQEDSWFQAAALSGGVQRVSDWFERVASREPPFTGPVESSRAFLERITSVMGAQQDPAPISRVLRFATQNREPLELRRAALSGLSQGMLRGGESEVELPAADQDRLLSLIGSDNEDIVSAALEIAPAIQLRRSALLERMFSEAVRKAGQGKSLEDRVNSIRLLGMDASESTRKALMQLLDFKEPKEVQTAAARSLLQQLDSSSELNVLVQKWKSFSPEVREVVWEGFSSRVELLKAFLEKVEGGEIEIATLSRTRTEQLMAYPNEEIQAMARRLFEQASSDRAAVIRAYQPALEQEGEVAAGKQVFGQNCSGCHRLEGAGSEVGPDLMDVIGRRSPEFFLSEILDPNKSISPGYETYLVKTSDNRIITGVIAEESPTSITLKRREGDEDTILRKNISQLRVSTVSAMPEGLEHEIAVEDMADLLSYLQRLGSPGPR